MRGKKYYIALDDSERRVVVNCLNEMRNNLIANGKYTDAVDEVLLKIIAMPSSSVRHFLPTRTLELIPTWARLIMRICTCLLYTSVAGSPVLISLSLGTQVENHIHYLASLHLRPARSEE